MATRCLEKRTAKRTVEPLEDFDPRPVEFRGSASEHLPDLGLLVLALRKLFSASRHSILASKAELTMTAVLCDGLAASPGCTGSEGVLLLSPHLLGPSSIHVTELLKFTPGD